MTDYDYRGHTFWYSGYMVQTKHMTDHGMDHWCGYVYIPDGHWYHGQAPNDIDLRVHGGLVYAAQEGSKWKIGFDCAHAGDRSGFCKEGVYRTEGYVIDQLKQMVDQIVVLD